MPTTHVIYLNRGLFHVSVASQASHVVGDVSFALIIKTYIFCLYGAFLCVNPSHGRLLAGHSVCHIVKLKIAAVAGYFNDCS